MMRLMGIDHGLARIGLAVSDALGLTARELAIIKRTTREADFEKIRRYADEQKVGGFVVGIPFNPDAAGQSHEIKARNWAERLRAETPLPVVLWDEQLSSQDAAEIARRQRRPSTAPIDDLAARVILQSYLDAVRDGLAAPPDETPHE